MRPVSYFVWPHFLTIALLIFETAKQRNGVEVQEMKRNVAAGLLGLAGLAGCTANSVAPANSAGMRHAFDARVVACTLPYLYRASDRVDIGYRYRDGDVTFDIKTDDTGLRDHVVSCATPENGPRGDFSGHVQIWGKQ
jgi:hypothetical protein